MGLVTRAWVVGSLVFPWVAHAGTLQGSHVESDHAWAALGTSVANAGDVNGDGFDDVVAGEPTFQPQAFGAYVGRAVVHLGSAAGLRSPEAWSFVGTQADEVVGRLVAGAGDVNGDGYADVLVSAPQHDGPAGADAGAVWLFFGSATGLRSPSDRSTWLLEGDRAGAMLGAIASAGDVNGDGFDDVILGAPNRGGGTAMLFLGGPTGPGRVPAWTYDDPVAGSSFGFSVARAGDVDRNGHPDVIVGSYSFRCAAGVDCGRVQVFLGSATGLATTPAWTVEGSMAGGMLGVSVAGAVDVDRDGFDDVVVSAPTQGGSGEVRLYRGSAAGLERAPSWTVHGNAAAGWMGSQVAFAEDFNGDGFGDVVVGAYRHADTLTEEGFVYVFLGSPSGLSSSAAWSGRGGQQGAHLGLAVATGDFNRDGWTDVVAGAPGWTSEEMDLEEGAVFLYLGCVDANRDGVCGDTVVDTDHDGDADATDCAPTNAAIHHGATDVPGDAIDQDCGGADAVACVVDMDGDGFPGTATVIPDRPCSGAGRATTSSDCNDNNPSVHVDCGAAPSDGGSPGADAAVATPDGGGPRPDAGTPVDAGAVSLDAGGPRPDAGRDAGEPVVADGSPGAPDASQDGSKDPPAGSCGCRAAPDEQPAGWMAAAAVLAVRRRRRSSSSAT